MGVFDEILAKNGAEGVDLLKESLEENDRVATGKTRDSIKYEVKDNVLRIFAADHITDLETGQTAEQIQSNPPDFSELQKWVEARGIGAGSGKEYQITGRIYESLLKNGWVTDRKNRTGENGGTAGIISDPEQIIIEQTTKDVAKEGVLFVTSMIKKELNAVNNK